MENENQETQHIKQIIRQTQYRPSLSKRTDRVKYLERVAGDIQNKLAEGAYTLSEQAKLYACLTATVKLIDEIISKGQLENYQKRIQQIEAKAGISPVDEYDIVGEENTQ